MPRRPEPHEPLHTPPRPATEPQDLQPPGHPRPSSRPTIPNTPRPTHSSLPRHRLVDAKPNSTRHMRSTELPEGRSRKVAHTDWTADFNHTNLSNHPHGKTPHDTRTS